MTDHVTGVSLGVEHGSIISRDVEWQVRVLDLGPPLRQLSHQILLWPLVQAHTRGAGVGPTLSRRRIELREAQDLAVVEEREVLGEDGVWSTRQDEMLSSKAEGRHRSKRHNTSTRQEARQVTWR